MAQLWRWSRRSATAGSTSARSRISSSGISREGTHGFVPVGTTGESPTLSHAEHERVVELCVEVVGRAAAGDRRHRLELDRGGDQPDPARQGAGADAALVVTPYYNKPTQEGLYAHYRPSTTRSTCRSSSTTSPGRSVVDMTPETMGRLARLPQHRRRQGCDRRHRSPAADDRGLRQPTSASCPARTAMPWRSWPMAARAASR